MERQQAQNGVPSSQAYRAAEPLWRIAPARDDSGESLADFMLLVPRMRARGPAFATHASQVLRRVCATFDGQVRFADLNLHTGAIWVSVEATPGLCARVARAIRAELPQALTVGGQLGALRSELSLGPAAWRLFRRVSRIRQLVVRRLLPSARDSGSR